MPLTLQDGRVSNWRVKKICVIGPGIVGMPMAALLAHAQIKEGVDEPAKVVVVQRASPTSEWKIDAINAGKSPIGGIEPELDRVVAESVARGHLRASSDYAELRDADVVLVCVQTDKCAFEPDYGPMFQALTGVAKALQSKPAENVPLIVFESTLAPSSMASIVRTFFESHGLVEGRDVLLGNSPNRVMPGRLVERVASSDKIVAGLHPDTPELIQRLYRRIVTAGTLHPTNSLTAEIVKTLENAYRDVRIAYAAEIVRWCDDQDVDYYALRDAVNTQVGQSDKASADANAVPSGALLVPTVGVGGHCLPKDGVLLWWRALEAHRNTDRSLILEARHVNDESPTESVRAAERRYGSLIGKRVALLGAAYRFNSEDTRNSPTLEVARRLLARGCAVTIHDPYVYPNDANLAKYGLGSAFTHDLGAALADAEIAFVCTAHRVYLEDAAGILKAAPKLKLLFDGCNAFSAKAFSAARDVRYLGIGRGTKAPASEFVRFVVDGFAAVERGVANEVASLVDFLNDKYAADAFNRVDFEAVRRIAGTCVTGCAIAERGQVKRIEPYRGFLPRLVQRATG